MSFPLYLDKECDYDEENQLASNSSGLGYALGSYRSLFSGRFYDIESCPIYVRVLTDVAYSFHMPLFMMISGFLFYKTRLNQPQRWSFKNTIRDKFIRLWIPGFCFSLLALVLKSAFAGEMSRQADLSLWGVFLSYLYPWDNPFRELWFIAALFWMFLLMPLWKISLKSIKYQIILLCTLIILHLYEIDIRLFCIDRTCKIALWFYMGVLVSEKNLADSVFGKHVYMTILIGLFTYIIGYFVHGSLLILGGIYTSLGLSLIGDRLNSNIFSSFRNYTYQIFLMGIFAQIFVKILYRHISMPYLPGYIACILIGIYSPVLISKIIEKLNIKILLYSVGLSKK